ncbi:transaldolase [Solirubrobacter sp. CPCC 204708]|uniref:Transaldolase n=1 Tax=Solirubrobacter deserti TaxID=2282478 RepID=A0ABT4RER8_9ACTN|nr:transaldolase [Solirubrobacter deserti]MBE2318579.1 transaldolase [Solirubrobacter deserti]MDA0137037.1 transaldolase [Solirubrobacter deserti]
MSATAVNERLAALTAAGTSIWLDQLSRGLIETGELARMVEQDSLQGVTSNPAIFEKSIGHADYDEDIQRLVTEGKSAGETYRALALQDVQAACDVLRPVYDRTDGFDGYVSWEVDPDLAHDTERTITQAREYWQAVDRPNLMIKIPATEAGIPAIEQAIYDGLNVNVTLLFAVEAYEAVMEAYIKGLERRQAEGLALDRHSVASFFVSRVDTEVDKRLEAAGNSELQGRAGLANARAAYAAYQRIFEGERFAALREAGAPVQRPLWASTGVKNPAYPATLYVWGLVAPNTVNTMPMATLEAARAEGGVAGATGAEDPSADLAALADAGIDLEDVTDKLLRDGIDAFVTPMENLLARIEAKRAEIAA